MNRSTLAAVTAAALTTAVFFAPGAAAGKPPPPPTVPTVQFQNGSYNYNESSSYAQIVLVRTGSTAAVSNVAFSTVDGSATAPADYGDSTGTVSFPAGYTAIIVQVPIVNDSLKESTESVNLRLATVAGGNAQIGKKNRATLSITDNDPCAAVSVNDSSAAEGDAMTFTVSMSQACSAPVQVSWHTTTTSTGGGVDATPVTDYDDTQHGTVAISSGNLSNTFSVSSLEDVTDEPDQTFNVVIDNPVNSNVSDATGVATINDDDTEPQVWVDSDWSGNEGDTATFPLELSAPSEFDVVVTMATDDADSTPGAYTPDAGSTVTIPAGTTTGQSYTVATTDDALANLNATLWVYMISATHATFTEYCTPACATDKWGQGTIHDNDPYDLAMSPKGAYAGSGDSVTYTATVTNQSGDELKDQLVRFEAYATDGAIVGNYYGFQQVDLTPTFGGTLDYADFAYTGSGQQAGGGAISETDGEAKLVLAPTGATYDDIVVACLVPAVLATPHCAGVTDTDGDTDANPTTGHYVTIDSSSFTQLEDYGFVFISP